MDPLELFRANLVSWMEKNGISQADLSRNSGIAPGNLSKYVTGKKVATAQVMDRIARAAGVPLWRLLLPPDVTIEFEPSPLQNRPLESISAQEKLQAAARALSDDEAAVILEIASNYLHRRAEQAVGLAKKPKKAQ